MITLFVRRLVAPMFEQRFHWLAMRKAGSCNGDGPLAPSFSEGQVVGGGGSGRCGGC